ncbi:hypothetical protein BHE74_00004289 [Ensete ventricosum]|nr:hypothetical protein BHE74_00004289 [Ensete ventricosum]RZS15073.1 hypothetical protein BHM03_00046853 [Ensete ventricosum]
MLIAVSGYRYKTKRFLWNTVRTPRFRCGARPLNCANRKLTRGACAVNQQTRTDGTATYAHRPGDDKAMALREGHVDDSGADAPAGGARSRSAGRRAVDTEAEVAAREHHHRGRVPPPASVAGSRSHVDARGGAGVVGRRSAAAFALPLSGDRGRHRCLLKLRMEGSGLGLGGRGLAPPRQGLGFQAGQSFLQLGAVSRGLLHLRFLGPYPPPRRSRRGTHKSPTM